MEMPRSEPSPGLPLFQALGFNILALDLRAHGESEGRYCTGGYFERHDVDQAINELRRRFPQQTRQVVLFGISLGAAVAAATAAMRDDIAAVVLECPFTDFRDAAMTHARVLGMPGLFFQKRALRLAERKSGADFSAVRPLDMISQMRCPLMIINSGADTLVDAEHAAQLKKGSRSASGRSRPHRLLVGIEGAEHVQSICLDPELYARQVGRVSLGVSRPIRLRG